MSAPPPLLDAPLQEPAQASASSTVEVHAGAESQPKRMKLGFDLLKKAGYSGVGGLGKRETGIAEPVAVSVAPESVGLGYVEGQLEENEETGGSNVPEEDIESDWVVVRVVPSGVTDAEMIALASKWGGARRMRRREGTVALRLDTPQLAADMVADCKRSGLRLGGSDVSCFLASPEIVLGDEERRAVVPVRPKMASASAAASAAAIPAALPPPAAPEPDGLSLLLQKLGAQIELPPIPVRGSEFSYDDEDEEEAEEKRPSEAKPLVLSSTASFLQQIRGKPVLETPKLADPKQLLSSLNSLRHILAAAAPVKKAEVAAVASPPAAKKADSPVVSPSPSPSLPPLPGREKFRALSDFEAREDTQVSFQKGDVMTRRFCDESSGWSEVELRGRVGWAPTNYLEPVGGEK